MPNLGEFLKYILEPGTRLAPKATRAPAAGDVLDFFDAPPDAFELAVEDAREAPQSFARYLLPLIFGSGGTSWPLLGACRANSRAGDRHLDRGPYLIAHGEGLPAVRHRSATASAA